MQNVLRMAGNCASHSLWSVSDGETLIPIVGYLKADGKLYMERLVTGSAQAIAIGETKMNDISAEDRGIAFVRDGFVTLKTGKTDSLVVDIKFSEDMGKKVQLLIPYRHAKHEKGFSVHRMKIVEIQGFAPEDVDWIMEAFIEGLQSHPEGGRIWAERYEDQAGVSAGFNGEEITDFSQEEFEKLKQTPFLIFFLVAAIDGKMDKKEVNEFMRILARPEVFKDRLFDRIVTNVISEIPSILRDISNKRGLQYLMDLAEARTIIDGRLDEAEARNFKMALMALGNKIAEASGGFLGFGSKISKEERAALAAIAVCLGIED